MSNLDLKNQENIIVLDGIMTMHFIGLTKLSQTKPIKEMTRFEKWVYLLYNSKKYAAKDSKIPSEIESEAGMTEVVDCVKKTNSDKEMRARMEDRENSQIALSIMRGSSYRKGKEDGIKEGIKKLIDVLRELGLTSEQISQTIQQKFNIGNDEANSYVFDIINNNSLID